MWQPVTEALPPKRESVAETHTLMLGVAEVQGLEVGVPPLPPTPPALLPLAPALALPLAHSVGSAGVSVGWAVLLPQARTLGVPLGVPLPPLALALAPPPEGVPVPEALRAVPRPEALRDTVPPRGAVGVALPPVALGERALPMGQELAVAEAVERGVGLDAL